MVPASDVVFSVAVAVGGSGVGSGGSQAPLSTNALVELEGLRNHNKCENREWKKGGLVLSNKE